MSESRVPIQENGAVTGVESPPERGSRWQVAGRALRHRNFQLFFSGQLISLIGTWMQSVAQSWLVYRLTGSALLLGSVGFASQVPVFVFAPLGGIAADRFNRRQIVIATQTAAMLLAERRRRPQRMQRWLSAVVPVLIIGTPLVLGICVPYHVLTHVSQEK